MRKNILWLVITVVITVLQLSGEARDNWAMAQLRDPKNHVAIVWPIAPQSADVKIEKLLNHAGNIVHKQLFRFNPVTAQQILQMAHPQITDLKKHVDWYFPTSAFAKPARIYIVRFQSLRLAVVTKLRIRKVLNLGYRALHINDTAGEARALGQLLF